MVPILSFSNLSVTLVLRLGCSKEIFWDPCFFALVLQRIAHAIDANDECLDFLSHAWYLEDGILARLEA